MRRINFRHGACRISVALALATLAGALNAESQEIASGPDVLRQLSLEELMDVKVTSVTKLPEAYGHAPAAIQIITRDEIRRSGATSIPEALRLADNLEVAQKNSHDWAISARGFNTALANKLLVLIDGRSVYTPLFSGVFWDTLDYLLEDIDRIEVISGPGGTLWGANAVNGVINIITRSAKDTQGAYLEAGGGSQLKAFGAGRYGGTLAPDVYYRAYAKDFDRGSSVTASGADTSDSWKMGQGGFRIDSGSTGADSFTVQGDLYNGDENVVTGGDAGVSGGNLQGRWTRRISGDSEMSLQGYYDRTRLFDPIPAFVFGSTPLAQAGVLKDDLDTYDLDFQYSSRLGKSNRIVCGLGYRFTHDVVGNAPGLAFFPPILNQRLFGGFAQDEITLRENLLFTLGTKLEHNDYTGFEWEPSGRLQWNPASNQMLWAAVSRAVRTPSRVDRDESEPAPTSLVILEGGRDFISETLIAYELGYRAELGPRLNVSVSAFYNDYDHVRSTSFTPTTILPLYFANNLEGETHGIEISANYQILDGWRIHAGFDDLNEHLRVKPGEVDINHALNETADPHQQASFRSSMDLSRSLELDAALRWIDRLEINNGGVAATVPGYCELDVRLGWHAVRSVELSVAGQNLLHDRHLEYGIPSPSTTEIERSVYGKATWRF